MKRALVPALSLVAGAAGGWFGCQHWRAAPGPAAAAPALAAAAEVPATPGAGTTAAAQPAAESAVKEGTPKRLFEDLRTLGRTERNPMRAQAKTLAMLDAMKPEEVFALAREMEREPETFFDGNSYLLRQTVFSKLAELNPDKALQTAMQSKDQWSRIVATGAVIQQLASSNPAAAEAAVAKMPPGYQRRNMISTLASAMAQTDGPAAVAVMQRMKIPPTDWAWRGLYGAWAAHDPARAAAQLQTMPAQTAQRCVDELSSQWARRDPEAAAAWAQSITDPALRNGALRSTVAAMATSDPARAMALASARPPGERRELLSSIASSMAESDTRGAITWAQTLTDPAERQRCLATVAGETAGYDHDASKEVLALLAPGAARNQALARLARSFSWSDPAAAVKWVSTLKAEEQAKVLPDIVDNLAYSDPDEAERLTASLPPAGDHSGAWATIARMKAMKDPATTLTWAAGLDTEQARVAATRAVFDQWAGHSPEDATAKLAGISDTNLRREATASLASEWAGRSPAEAERWANTLSGDDKLTALAAVWQASATDDPQAAGRSLAASAALAGTESAADKIANSAGTIAKAWTSQNPSEAATWAVTLPNGKVRDQALGAVAGEWVRYDPEAASAWIDSLPHDSSRDAAVGRLVSSIAANDPQSAFTWASSVQSEEKRIEALKSAANSWKAVNPDAAREAVRTASIPEADRARILESLQ